MIVLEAPAVTLVTPYFAEGASVRVFDGSDAVPSVSRRLETGAQVSGEKTILPTTPWQPGKFSVLILASGYTDDDMGVFRTAAAGVKANLRSKEPFAANLPHININVFENKADLGCDTGCYNIDRLLCCDQEKVVSAAAGSGYYYDEILVIHRTDTYAGGGYRGADYKTNSYNTYCAIYDGYWATAASLHEFGHSFGNLCDEYSYGSEGYTYQPCVNCRQSCAAFADYTSACNASCDAEPSYFRPEASVMLDLSHNSYNQASIKASYSPDGLEKILHYFIDPIFYTLTMVKHGTGTGSIVSTPPGIDCGDACSASFLKGTVVTVTAAADAGSVFVSWSKEGCGGSKDCALQMNGGRALTATFNPPCTYAFSPTAKPFPSGGGTVTLAVKAREPYACRAPVLLMPYDWMKAAASSPWKNNRGSSVQVTVKRNPNSTPRNGSMTIGGGEFDVTQTGAPCAITSLGFTPLPFPKAGGAGTLTVRVSPKDCTWGATSAQTWIRVPSGQGSGDAALTITVDANGPKPRTGSIRVLLVRPPKTGKAVQVNQRAH